MADILTFLYPPDQAAYAVVDGTSVISTALDGGSSRYRADLLGAPAKVTVQWTFDPLEYQYSKAFFKSGVNGGADAFLIDLYIDNSDLTTHTAHFVPGTFSLASQTGNTFVVTATLEVEPNDDDAALNWALVQLTNVYGAQVPDLLNALEKLANVDLGSI